MSFGAIYELQIPEDGTLQISNTNPIGKVQLQQTLGDQFATFHTMTLTGNISAQTIVMQPGKYKIIYPVNPNLPQAGTKELEFVIKSNKNTLLEL